MTRITKCNRSNNIVGDPDIRPGMVVACVSCHRLLIAMKSADGPKFAQYPRHLTAKRPIKMRDYR